MENNNIDLIQEFQNLFKNISSVEICSNCLHLILETPTFLLHDLGKFPFNITIFSVMKFIRDTTLTYQT